MSDVKKEVSPLSEEHLRQIDVEYAELNDSDIIERLAYLEINNNEKRIVISDIKPTKKIMSVSNQIFEIQKDFQKIKNMFELFITDVSDFLSIKNKLESKELKIEEADVNRFMIHYYPVENCSSILMKTKSNRNIPRIVRNLIVYIGLQAISMIRTLLIDFVIL